MDCRRRRWRRAAPLTIPGITPGPFLTLLGKVLPMQVAGNDGDRAILIVTRFKRAGEV